MKKVKIGTLLKHNTLNKDLKYMYSIIISINKDRDIKHQISFFKIKTAMVFGPFPLNSPGVFINLLNSSFEIISSILLYSTKKPPQKESKLPTG